MKLLQKFVFLILILFCLFFFILTVNAEGDQPDAICDSMFHLKVHLFDSRDAYTFIHEYPALNNGTYYLFLPSDCHREHLLVSFDEKWFVINNKSLVSGDYTDAFREDGIFNCSTPNLNFELQVLSSDSLPTVFISTESRDLSFIHLDKANKESGTLTVVDKSEVLIDSIDMKYIKGRGNSSWQSNEKRSYNIKLEKQTQILDLQQAKKWVLTSNNMDVTLMRNAMAYTLAHCIKVPYTIDFRFIDLYINGSYRGVYMLCEKIEVGKNHLQITDLDKENERYNPGFAVLKDQTNGNLVKTETKKWVSYPNEPVDISGGYLLEYDYIDQFFYHSGAFISQGGSCLVLQSPEFPSKSEIDYISSLYNDFEEALYSKSGFNKKKRSFLEYIDLDSFVDGVLFYELTQDQDHGYSSWYIFSPEEKDLFFMGPLWDFDQAFETPDQPLEFSSSLAKRECGLIKKQNDENQFSFIELLCSHMSFVQAMKNRLPAFLKIVSKCFEEEIKPQFDLIKKAAFVDQIRWGYSIDQKKDVELISYIDNRQDEMRSCFNSIEDNVKLAKSKMLKTTHSSLKLRVTIPLVSLFSCLAAFLLLGSIYLIKKPKSFQNTLDKRDKR